MTSPVGGEAVGRSRRRTIRLILADRQRITRAGIEKLLVGEPEFEIAGTAEDAAAAIQIAKREQADVIVIDLPSLVDGSSIEEIIASLIAAKSAGQPQGLVVLTAIEDLLLARRALAAGCNSYLLKSDSP